MLDLSQAGLDRALAKVFSVLPHLHPSAPGAAVTVGSLVCDVTREADVEAAVRAVDGWGGVDVLVNNAGIMHADDADAVGTPEKVWDLTMDVNVKGVWFGSKHAVLALRRHAKARGSVINVASVVALVGSATPQLAYTASKGAVLAMTRELAIVHAREGFRFNALCPAPLK
jgi:NAD(P)-dependent dehydrogenase (short-subunit alcohol dehydrogenase family)